MAVIVRDSTQTLWMALGRRKVRVTSGTSPADAASGRRSIRCNPTDYLAMSTFALTVLPHRPPGWVPPPSSGAGAPSDLHFQGTRRAIVR